MQAQRGYQGQATNGAGREAHPARKAASQGLPGWPPQLHVPTCQDDDPNLWIVPGICEAPCHLHDCKERTGQGQSSAPRKLVTVCQLG